MNSVLLLDRISRAWRRRASGLLRPFGISLAQFQLVSLARRRGPISPSFAAQELDFDKPTICLIMKNCIHAGWLASDRLVTDRRSILLELTGQGEELLDRIEAARIFAPAAFGDPLDVLGADERAALLRSLDRVSRRAADIWAGKA